MISDSISSIRDGMDISEERSYLMMSGILNGYTSVDQNTTILNSLCAKGETDKEISGMLRAMREAAITVNIANPNAIDVCGTGGDGLRTVNISTAAAFIASSVGCAIAKHGNRSSSGAVGSADIFEALGCNLYAAPEEAALCIEKTNVCFMFAPQYHPSMRYVAKARELVGKRTVFNLLGPLCNPAHVKKHLVGVSSVDLLGRISKILLKNGSNKVLAVTSKSGMDELSSAGPSRILESDLERVNEYTISPKDLGLQECNMAQLQVTGKRDAFEKFVGAIDGSSSHAICDTVCMNAAAAMITANLSKNMVEGFEESMNAVKSGIAAKHLESFVKYCGKAELLEEIRANA